MIHLQAVSITPADALDLQSHLLTDDQKEPILQTLEDAGISRDVIDPLSLLTMSNNLAPGVFQSLVEAVSWGDAFRRYMLHHAAETVLPVCKIMEDQP